MCVHVTPQPSTLATEHYVVYVSNLATEKIPEYLYRYPPSRVTILGF